MRISVSLCTYNGEKYIKEQLQSILTQTRQIDEIVICDDKSSDATVSVMNDILQTSDIKYKIVCNPKKIGLIKNFEKCISLCTGDLVFFSDQDDVWEPYKVEKMSRIFENNPNCVLCYSDAVVMNSDLSEVLYSSLNKRYQIKFNIIDAIDGRVPHGCTEAVKKSFIRNVMPFRFAHDHWSAMCAPFYGDVECVDETLIKYRRHRNAVTGYIRYIPHKTLLYKIRSIGHFIKTILRGITKEEYFGWPTSCLDSYSSYIELFGSILKKKSPEAYIHLKEKIACTETLNEVCHTSRLKGIAKLLNAYPQNYKRGNIKTLIQDVSYLLLTGIMIPLKKKRIDDKKKN